MPVRLLTMTSISLGGVWTVTILKWSSTCLKMKVSLGIQLFQLIWNLGWQNLRMFSFHPTAAEINHSPGFAFCKNKTRNDPKFWTTFGIPSLRQNLRMFSFRRIAAVEIKTLSRVFITQGAQNENLFLHILFFTSASPSDLSWPRCPFLCINVMYCAHLVEDWYFVRCA